MKIRTLIVDDEPLARSRIVELLKDRDAYEVVGEFGTAEDAAEALPELAPDLLFLDIEMPGLDGFDLLEALDSGDPPVVIFVTAFDQYARRAFDVYALDYLVKPFDDDRFAQSLSRAERELKRENDENLRSRLLRILADDDSADPAKGPESDRPNGNGRRDSVEYLDRIIIKSGDKVLLQKTEEIDWIEAADYYARIHVGERSYLVRESLSRLEERLDPHRFARIHRSSIINLDRVRELHPWFHGAYLVILEDGTELRLSRGRKDQLKDLLGNTL